MTITWTHDKVNNYLRGVTLTDSCDVVLSNKKIACFDFDDTLVMSIKKFSDDWILYDDSVKFKLLEYIKNGYRIVILSNQKGIGNGKTDMATWQKKVEDFYKLVNVPFMIVAALGDNEYRKPLTGMWELLDGCKTSSFFCGDAGGLPKRVINNRQIDKDFSDTDLKFALNIGIRFMHRDEFIFGVKQVCIPSYPKLDIKHDYPDIILDNKTVVINVGYPGSGKSSFVNSRYPHATIINQDILKTKSKCMNLYKSSLKSNINLIIIDNTNPSVSVRKEYIDLAKSHDYKLVCFNFLTSKELSKHNNYYRAHTTNIKVVPTIAYNIYGKKFNNPSIGESFDKIYDIEFSCAENTDAKYFMYYF